MKIGVLTSSRADFGIYLPLLKKLHNDNFFNLEIIAFGTHLSKLHGFTLKQIENQNFLKIHSIASLISFDDEQAIATSYALTVLKFSDFWQIHKYDIVLSLGDRFEMSAAVQAGIPFNVKFAHIHGGETTLGAIDNVYRHQISLASKLHFTSTEEFKKKVIQLTGIANNVFNVGSLSLDEIEKFNPIPKDDFLRKFNIPDEDFVLITFHPETLNLESNIKFASEMRRALIKLSSKLFLIITMPNADTNGSIYRAEIEQIKKEVPNRVICIENFGKENYFSAMKYSRLLIGNTSSGIIEAATFGKYVVNVGDRQKGRLQSENIINTKFLEQDILESAYQILQKGSFEGVNKYFKNNSADLIVNLIKQFNEVI